MNTNYNATITYDSRDHEQLADDIVDTFGADHHGVAVVHPLGYVQAIITLPAETVRQAAATAAALAAQIEREVLGIDVMRTDVFDAASGLQPVPEWASVTEVAERLGVSRQAVLERLNRGTLAGHKQGKQWVVDAHLVRELEAEQIERATAAVLAQFPENTVVTIERRRCAVCDNASDRVGIHDMVVARRPDHDPANPHRDPVHPGEIDWCPRGGALTTGYVVPAR